MLSMIKLIKVVLIFIMSRILTVVTGAIVANQELKGIRKTHVQKDADIIIKMTKDFVTEMKLKMAIIKRVEKTYGGSADFSTGTVFSDINKKFKHMCDLYKKFATVRRYVLGHELNTTNNPNPDVVMIYQFMLSDYNEILLMLELFKSEQSAWRQGVETTQNLVMIQKQMEKLGNLPADLALPPIMELTGADLGNKKKEQGRLLRTQRKRVARPGQWRAGEDRGSARRWSGELEGVGFDER